jgi:hypothetical protein
MTPHEEESVIIRYFKGSDEEQAFLLGQVLAMQGLMQLLRKS